MNRFFSSKKYHFGEDACTAIIFYDAPGRCHFRKAEQMNVDAQGEFDPSFKSCRELILMTLLASLISGTCGV